MPGGNGTGPAGAGPMTGRAAGYCAGNSIPGYANSIRGRGLNGGGGFRGRGFAQGRGMGRRNWNQAMPQYPYSTQEMTPENEIEMLKNQAKFMQEDITAVNKQITELEKIAGQQKKS